MRALLSIATAAFALTSVVQGGLFSLKAKGNATTDAQIYVYPFESHDCSGPSIANDYLDVKQGQCVNYHEAFSLKTVFRSDHADWVKEINELRLDCKVITFSAWGCLERNRTIEYKQGFTGDLPQDFQNCLVSSRQKNLPRIDNPGTKDDEGNVRHNVFLSLRFVCSKPKNPEYLCTKTVEHTSWSIDPTYGNAHRSVITATYTGSLSATAHVAARSASAKDPHPVAVEKNHPVLVKRGFKPGPNNKFVWMLHPWSHAWICYSCHTKKAHDFTQMECRSGHEEEDKCGAVPSMQDAPAHTTTTETRMASTTTHATTTKTKGPYKGAPDCLPPVCTCVDCPLATKNADYLHDSEFPHLDIHKRSWHTPVKFAHPFLDGKEACADAEWEKRSQGDKSYVKLQHVHICDEKDRADSQWIGLPKTAVHTLRILETTTSTIMHTAYSSPRHDQL